MPPKFIQIACASNVSGSHLYALGDDGVVYFCHGDRGWVKLDGPVVAKEAKAQ